jgi:hypothetical protein
MLTASAANMEEQDDADQEQRLINEGKTTYRAISP